jgi:preprotein translocase subunit SecD
LLIVAVGACGGGRRDDRPLVILEYDVAPGDGQADEQARDRAINAMRMRIDARAVTEPVVVPHGKSGIHVELRGDPDVLEQTIAILERTAALGIHPIVEDDAGMQAIYDAAMQEKPPGIFPMFDSWRGADDVDHRSLYLWSADPKVLDTWLHARPPAQHVGNGRRLVLEREDHPPAAAAVRWRTHVIDLAASVTGKDVASAKVTYDEMVVRPQVELTLTADGTRRFGEATAAMVGHKLAIVLDGRVVSAPVVNAPIPGGRIVIAMGAGDEKQVEREAFDLVETLKAGSMPPIRRLSERHVGPAR